jgi:hypothetical protein
VSELQEIGTQVSAVARDIVGHAQELSAMAQRLKQAAAQAAASVRGAEGDTRAAQQVAAALENAARHCTQAAHHLMSGKQAAESFVARHVGSTASASHKTFEGTAPSHGPPLASAIITDSVDTARAGLSKCLEGLDRWGEADQQRVARWYGNSNEATRGLLRDRVARVVDALATLSFHPAEAGTHSNVFAYVNSEDTDHKVYLASQFWQASDQPPDAQSGVIVHEVSHFKDVGATKDYKYGRERCEQLARDAPGFALDNADSFEYYYEDYL